ncbi:MAG TPA: hypothetical protein VEU08_14400, partial [Vicinamibacterales bacterium]|nr:hypothetical protein [Vicinamibacterales bacterium]
MSVMTAVAESRPRDVSHPVVSAVPASVHAARAVTTVGVLQISVLFVTLLRSKLIAMLLHPEGVGIVSTLDQLTQLVAQVSTFSLIATPTRFLARSVIDGLDAVTRMYSVLLKLLLISTAVGCAGAVALLLVKPGLLGAGLQTYGGLAIIAVLGAPVFALSGFLGNVAAAVRGYLTTSVYVL